MCYRSWKNRGRSGSRACHGFRPALVPLNQITGRIGWSWEGGGQAVQSKPKGKPTSIAECTSAADDNAAAEAPSGPLVVAALPRSPCSLPSRASTKASVTPARLAETPTPVERLTLIPHPPPSPPPPSPSKSPSETKSPPDPHRRTRRPFQASRQILTPSRPEDVAAILRRWRVHRAAASRPASALQCSSTDQTTPTTGTSNASVRTKSLARPRRQPGFELPANHSQRLRWARRLASTHVPLCSDPPFAAGQHKAEPAVLFPRGVLDYNYIVRGLYEQRRARWLSATVQAERRIHRRVIAGVVPVRAPPLEAALGADGAGAALAVRAVLDDGHLTCPIVLCEGELLPRTGEKDQSTEETTTTAEGLQTESEIALRSRGSTNKQKSESRAEEETEENGIALLVRPFAEEVRDTQEVPPRRRVWPKGREWDRQRAIQDAVGTTAQEAIIDLKLDPRYRRPGEYVRWRYSKTQRRMQVIP